MLKKSHPNKDQIVSQLQKFIIELGQPHLGGGRQQFFWRAARVCGVPSSRLKTIFYNMGVNPSAVEYIMMSDAISQLRADRALAEARQKNIQTKRRSNAMRHQMASDSPAQNIGQFNLAIK